MGIDNIFCLEGLEPKHFFAAMSTLYHLLYLTIQFGVAYYLALSFRVTWLYLHQEDCCSRHVYYGNPDYHNTGKKVIRYMLLLFSCREMRSCSLNSVGKCIFKMKDALKCSSEYHKVAEFVETIAVSVRNCSAL